jgi:phage tail sheath protein FI
MLRTIVHSDDQSYPWLAPAGTRRGSIDNLDALGFIDTTTGEFQQIATRMAVRDTLYENNVNPLTFIPGTGLVNYGNKTTQSGTALDRINVARLVSYIRQQTEGAAKTFIFEPNDKLTRDEIKGVIESILNDLIAKRGIFDYLVVCDESNNTPARIDRNELYVDIAIEPVKSVEFIFIPIRIKNTGEIATGGS